MQFIPSRSTIRVVLGLTYAQALCPTGLHLAGHGFHRVSTRGMDWGWGYVDSEGLPQEIDRRGLSGLCRSTSNYTAAGNFCCGARDDKKNIGSGRYMRKSKAHKQVSDAELTCGRHGELCGSMGHSRQTGGADELFERDLGRRIFQSWALQNVGDGQHQKLGMARFFVLFFKSRVVCAETFSPKVWNFSKLFDSFRPALKTLLLGTVGLAPEHPPRAT